MQVKGSSDPLGNKLDPGDTGDVMRRLGAMPVGASHLLTNRPLSTGLAEQCTSVESERSSFDRFAYHPGDLGAAGAGQFILVDNRSVDDLAASVAEHIRSIRADRVLSQGEPTARMVSMVLLHNIFRSAAGATTERFAASDVLALLKMPDNAVAHALEVSIGEFRSAASRPSVRQFRGSCSWTRSPPRCPARQTVVSPEQQS